MNSPKLTATNSVSFYTVTSDQSGQRLDNFLLRHFKTLPKSKLYQIIRKGEIRINKGRVKPEYRVQAGDEIRIPPLRIEAEANLPLFLPETWLQKMRQAVLYDKDGLVVLNKPEGLAVHKGSGLKFGVIDLMRQLYGEDIELVHRLDRDTSGCLMLATQRKTLTKFHELLRSKQLQKTYLAYLHGHLNKTHVVVNQPLSKYERGGERFMEVSPGGQASETHFDVLAKDEVGTWVLAKPITGRTHQIRVHAAWLGHAIWGDDKYAKAATHPRGISRLMLHALHVEFPGSRVSAPIDDSFKHLMPEKIKL